MGAARAGQQEDDLGKLHFAAGQHYFHQERFAEALAEFAAGYELTHKPGFLIDMAQCHRQLGDPAKAIPLYQTFLVEAPDSPLAPEANRMLADAQRELEHPELRPTRESMALPSGKRPVYRRWWFWTALGATAAVALGVGLGVGLAQGQKDFHPNQPPLGFGAQGLRLSF